MSLQPFAGLVWRPGRGIRPLSGNAETLVWLATSPDVANVSGGYFFDQEPRPPSPEAQDADTAQRLWEISEQQCAVSGRSAEAVIAGIARLSRYSKW
jgi:hypothetical protein